MGVPDASLGVFSGEHGAFVESLSTQCARLAFVQQPISLLRHVRKGVYAFVTQHNAKTQRSRTTALLRTVDNPRRLRRQRLRFDVWSNFR